ncbi:transglutaminase-like family protein, partial [Aquabacterium sp. A08]|uniref:transglutaminase-like family protein n=1 Tax=Aquabacterium sp. A08 TaxID=2718532 RepID=UPI0014203B3E
PYHIEQDPSAPRDPLPDGASFKRQYAPHQIGGGFAEGGVVSMQSSTYGVADDGTPVWQGDPNGLGVPGAAPAQPMSA